MDGILFHTWMGGVFVIDQGGARHDETGVWGMRLRSGNEIARAVEIGAPNRIGIRSSQNRGKVHDRRDALHGLLQRIGVEKVALQGRGSSRKFLARPYERAAADASVHEPPQKARAHETRSACN
jgi:hypothetical protein